jgi:hypothetical protein
MGMGVSILVLAMGAILTFAVSVGASGGWIDLHTVGVILLGIGALGVTLSVMFWSTWDGYPRQRSRTEGNITIID